MKTAPVLSHLLLYFRLTWMQHEWSYGVVTMVTDEGEDEKWHGAERLSTAPPAPNTGRGSGWFLRWGVSWGASADTVAVAAGAWQGQDLKGIATSMEQEIENLQFHSRVYNPQLCQSLEAGGRQRREWLQRCRKCMTRIRRGSCLFCSTWFSGAVLGAGKSWNRHKGWGGESESKGMEVGGGKKK